MIDDPPSGESSLPTPDVNLDWSHSLDAEAMRRRIGERLFGDAERPTYLGRFRVLRTLGVGGMGVVYSAEDDTLGRVVALKVIRDEVLKRDGDRQRILREARALARLPHPNIVQLHEIVTTDEAMFLVMEYIAGTTLSQWLRGERRNVSAIIAVLAGAARGLAAAHRAGVVHRDVKPSNILVGDDGRVRIVDFGIARGVTAPSTASVDPPTPSQHPTPQVAFADDRTRTGTVAGTPAYMAPEAFLGHIDARSDQFTFCVTLYESVFGSRPFGDDVASGMQLLHRPLVVPSKPRIPRRLRQVLERGLALRAHDRFATMDELVAVLDPPPSGRPWLGLALSTALLGTLFAFFRSSGPAAPDVCPSADAKLQDTWTPIIRQSVRTAILSTNLPFATRTADVVEERLDAYAERWLAAQHEACEATWVRGERSQELLDAGMRCLEQRRQSFAALTHQLRRPDVGMVTAAIEMVHGLDDFTACNDLDALARPEPRDSDHPQLADIRARLVQAEAHQRAHEAATARTVLDQVLADLRTIGDPKTEAEALRLRGFVLGHALADAGAGAKDLHAALDLAVASGHDGLLWRIWKDLADIAAFVEQDIEEARQLLDHARVALKRSPPGGPNKNAFLLDTEGEILHLEDRLAEALTVHQQALAMRLRDYEPHSPDVLFARHRVANATAFAGQLEPAAELYRALIDDARRAFGDTHPMVASFEMSEARALAELRPDAETRARMLEIRAKLVQALGDNSPQLPILDIDLSRLDAAVGDVPQAITRAREALALASRSLPPHHDQRIWLLTNLAGFYQQTDDVANQLAVFQELLAIRDEHPIGVELDELLYNIGDALCKLNRCAEGADAFTRLLAMPLQGHKRAFPFIGLAYVHLAAGAPDLALQRLEQAYPLVHAAADTPPMVVLDVTRLLIRALTELRRDRKRVRRLEAEAAALTAKIAAAQ